MPNDDAPSQPPKTSGPARRGRPGKSKNGRESDPEAAFAEDQAPESAVATVEPEAAEPPAEARPEGGAPGSSPPPESESASGWLQLVWILASRAAFSMYWPMRSR